MLIMLAISSAALAQGMNEERAMIVGPSRVICTGVGPQWCLQVKDSSDSDYQLFYSPIEGFDYQPGFEYELRVAVSEVENPPADASNLSYALIEVVSMTRVLESNQWLLESYRNAEGAMVDTLADTPVTLEFTFDGIGGSAGCNSYFGGVTLDGSAITISDIISTLMLCAPDNLMNQEAAYLQTLATVAAYTITDDQLQMTNAAGEMVLTFTASVPEPLIGTNWVLTSYLVGGDAVAGVLPDVEVTAMFDAQGGLSGSAGCNSYSAGYTDADGMLSVGPAVSTRMACAPESVMGQEIAYLSALENIVFYQIRANRLDLLDANGSVLLSFQADSL
jgi:heat shock protein HslJ